jgi:hypothetical protein
MAAQPVRLVRILGLLSGVVALVLAGAFLLRIPLVQSLWPWTGTYDRLAPLSYIFLASVLVAFGFPALWLSWRGELRAAAPIALDAIVVFAGWTVFMLQDYLAGGGSAQLLVTAIGCAVVLLGFIAAYTYTRRIPIQDPRPTPRLVRASFVVFIVVLLVAGAGLVLKLPNVFPWRLTAEASVLYGWAFWGAAAYFAYGLFQPRWALAAGQLIGFLAYDLVLIVPYVQHLAVVRDENRLSLIIYLVVITLSALLASYYLFVNERTRLFRSLRPALAT